MEPSASMAVWNGKKLTLYEATQWVAGARNVVPIRWNPARRCSHRVLICRRRFRLQRVVWPHSVCAAVAAGKLGRPVKVVLSRQEMFTSVDTVAPRARRSRLRSSSGKLTAIQHENLTDARWSTISSSAANHYGFLTTVQHWLKNTGVALEYRDSHPDACAASVLACLPWNRA